MKLLKLKINGKEYPCAPTGSALLEFERLTGRDVSQMRDHNMSDMLTYLYCCLKGACKRENQEWPYDGLDAFATDVDINDINNWSRQMTEMMAAYFAGGEEKKTCR